MLLRLALLLGLVILVMLLVQRWARSSKGQQRQGQDQRPQPLARCVHCGINLPAQEVVWRGGRPHCSEAHAQQAQDPKPRA